jgi:hypothetical protein
MLEHIITINFFIEIFGIPEEQILGVLLDPLVKAIGCSAYSMK